MLQEGRATTKQFGVQQSAFQYLWDRRDSSKFKQGGYCAFNIESLSERSYVVKFGGVDKRDYKEGENIAESSFTESSKVTRFTKSSQSLVDVIDAEIASFEYSKHFFVILDNRIYKSTEAPARLS